MIMKLWFARYKCPKKHTRVNHTVHTDYFIQYNEYIFNLVKNL